MFLLIDLLVWRDLKYRNFETLCCHIYVHQMSLQSTCVSGGASHLKNFKMATTVAIWISECMVLANFNIYIELKPPAKFQLNPTCVLDAILDIHTEPLCQIKDFMMPMCLSPSFSSIPNMVLGGYACVKSFNMSAMTAIFDIKLNCFSNLKFP